jgi:hypothetical protein
MLKSWVGTGTGDRMNYFARSRIENNAALQL